MNVLSSLDRKKSRFALLTVITFNFSLCFSFKPSITSNHGSDSHLLTSTTWTKDSLTSTWICRLMGIIANIYCRAHKKPVTSAVRRGRLRPPDTGQRRRRKGGREGENSREMWRDATWENELMRHQLCDSTVAVCAAAKWFQSSHFPDFFLLWCIFMNVTSPWVNDEKKGTRRFQTGIRGGFISLSPS